RGGGGGGVARVERASHAPAMRRLLSFLPMVFLDAFMRVLLPSVLVVEPVRRARSSRRSSVPFSATLVRLYTGIHGLDGSPADAIGAPLVSAGPVRFVRPSPRRPNPDRLTRCRSWEGRCGWNAW